MENLGQQTIETIIVNNFKVVKIFKTHKIDFYLRRTTTLVKACNLAGIDETCLEREIDKILKEERFAIPDYENFGIDAFTNYIEEKYHRYIYDQIPVIISCFTDISELYGYKYPAIVHTREQFLQLSKELSNHIIRQENVLFPAIRSMVRASKKKLKYNPFLGDVKDAISKGNQESRSNLLNKIIDTTNDYLLLLPACELLKATVDALEELEKNLYLHFYLETNVLFPKSLKMEEMMLLDRTH